jgi:hypothetical protein
MASSSSSRIRKGNGVLFINLHYMQRCRGPVRAIFLCRRATLHFYRIHLDYHVLTCESFVWICTWITTSCTTRTHFTSLCTELHPNYKFVYVPYNYLKKEVLTELLTWNKSSARSDETVDEKLVITAIRWCRLPHGPAVVMSFKFRQFFDIFLGMERVLFFHRVVCTLRIMSCDNLFWNIRLKEPSFDLTKSIRPKITRCLEQLTKKKANTQRYKVAPRS